MKKYLWLTGIAALVLTGCGRQPIEKFEKIDQWNWKYSAPNKFEVNIDEAGDYRAYLQIRYNQDYPFSNIWVGLTEAKPDGKTEKARFNIQLFDLGGKAYGSFAGKLFDRSFPDAQTDGDKLTLHFDQPGKYIFTLQQLMRTDNLQGITEVGLRLRKLK